MEEKPFWLSATKIVLLLFSSAIVLFSGYIVITTGEIPEPFSLSLSSIIAFYFGQKTLTQSK